MSSKKFSIIGLTLLFLLVFVGACSELTATQTNTASTKIPPTLPVVVSDPNIVVEGKLVPNQYLELSFSTSGKVEEVFVSEGDLVEADQILVRLEDEREFASRASVEASIASAQLEFVSAQKQLDELYINAPLNSAKAYKELNDAINRRDEAQRDYDNLGDPADTASIEQAEANLAIAEHDLQKAKEDFKPYENKPETNLTRASLLSKKAEAQAEYDDAVRRLNSLLGGASESRRAEIEAELVIAKAELEYAQLRYDTIKDGPDPNDVELAEARVANAKAQLAAAEAELEDLEEKMAEPPPELRAPFSGTITQINVQKGEMITTSKIVIVLADFSNWIVETDDLTEINVVHVSSGQEASIVADALTDVEMSGRVSSISNLYEEKRGDVTYTARIQVDEIDPRLRWGMTVTVALEKP